MIPARTGSERLRYKNLRLLRNKPVISYAIEAAKKANIFDDIILNSDGICFNEIAKRHKVKFYHRPAELANSQTRSDDVIADFMERFDGDVLVWVNPIAPLQPAEEINNAVSHFLKYELDTLITVKNEQTHCLYKGLPINYDTEELFAKTQDLIPVQCMVYSVMMWRYSSFLDHYAKNGYALLSGKVGYFPVSFFSTIILKHEEDIQLAEAVLLGRENDVKPAYDPVAEILRS